MKKTITLKKLDNLLYKMVVCGQLSKGLYIRIIKAVYEE